MEGPINARERAFSAVLPWISRRNAFKAKARMGSADNRAFYARLASQSEAMVAVLLDIARATPEVTE